MTRVLLALAALSATALVALALLPDEFDRRPRLADGVDGGTMARFLESDAERQTIVDWAESRSRRDGWRAVAQIFESRCVTCHGEDAPFHMLRLDEYQSAVESAIRLPILLEKIEGGTMAEYLETADEQRMLREWILRGARRDSWEEAEAILARRCVHCHNPEGVQGLVPLDRYEPVARLSRFDVPRPKPFAPPAVLLGVSLAGLALSWLRRTTR